MPKVGNSPRQATANVADVLWCYAKLDEPGIGRQDAPTGGAWNMLLWAREARTRFYTSVLPKAIVAAQPDANLDQPIVSEEQRREKLLEAMRDFERNQDRRLIADVPDEIVDDAKAVVTEWEQKTCPDLPAECTEALVAQVAFAIHAAVCGAADNPAAFACNFAGDGRAE